MAVAGTTKQIAGAAPRRAADPLAAYASTLMLVGGGFMYAATENILLVGLVVFACGVSLAVIRLSEKLNRLAKGAEPK